VPEASRARSRLAQATIVRSEGGGGREADEREAGIAKRFAIMASPDVRHE